MLTVISMAKKLANLSEASKFLGAAADAKPSASFFQTAFEFIIMVIMIISMTIIIVLII